MKKSVSGLPDRAQALLRSAAEEARERLAADKKRVPSRLKPLIAYIDEHLFDPQLSVAGIKRDCGLRDNSIALRFHAQVGAPPKRYITELRLGTAARLLRDTHLKVWQIGELVGYSGLPVFSKAFDRWAGRRPTVYRRQFRSRQEANPAPVEAPPGVPQVPEAADGPYDDETLQRALDGTLPLPEACALLAHLQEIYRDPGSTTEAPAGDTG
jgi:AraC-like DNA-binding protein